MTVANQVKIPLPDGAHLDAGLDGPESGALVIFAHGSGSSRHSPRNQRVADILNEGGLRTLLVDLLTLEEEETDLVTAGHRFDIELLGERVGHAIDWAVDELRPLGIGLFGASTGAAAALVAAASRPLAVGAIVSRGGRPDLAEGALAEVRAPTLLIVGGQDTKVLDLNRSTLEALGPGHELEIVAGATHLFEEPGALDQVAGLASDWFRYHLAE